MPGMEQKTPLYDEHTSLKARMAPFAGWSMPIQYAGILAEHQHTRTAVSVFDVSHMGEFELSGPTAESDLERLLTQRVSTIKLNQCRYGFLLDDAGGVIDDLTCYRLGPDRFWLVVNAGTRVDDAAWIKDHLSAETIFTDCSDETAKLDIQGPNAQAALARVAGEEVPSLRYFHSTPWHFRDVPCLLSRTGYTGEWGYECYLPTDQAVSIWRALLADPEIQPAGLGARDTLRLEVGYSLYGHELSRERTPVAAVGKAFMDLTKPFIGSEAVKRDLEAGTPERLVALQLDSKRAARAGDPVRLGDRQVGTITSGSLAPSLGTAIALAYVNADCAHEGTKLVAETRGTPLPAKVVSLPFYREGTARG